MVRGIRQGRRGTAWKIAVAAIVIAGAPAAMAGKPGGGGGTAPALDGGMIWYWEADGLGNADLCRMRSDGSDKQQLAGMPRYNEAGHADYVDVSRGTHGVPADRWLLFVLPVDDSMLTNPQGIAHHEVYAVRESGGERVRLTNGASLDGTRIEIEPDYSKGANSTWTSWAGDPSFSADGGVEDGKVTFFAHAWTPDGKPAYPGLYQVIVDWNDLTASVPVRLGGVVAPFRGTADEVWTGWSATMSGPLIGGTHDWSADGTRCVYATSGIRVLDGGASYFLRDGAQPQWNPVTNEILYVALAAAEPSWEVRLMGPDGAGDRLLVAEPANTKSTTKFIDRPLWSPRGTWAGYLNSETQRTSGSKQRDVWVVPASGTGARNVTNDATSDFATPVAWR